MGLIVSIEQRADELEVKVAFLEEALNNLSDEYYRQQLLIKQLELQLQIMQQKFQNLKQADLQDSDCVDDKPPHY